MRDQASMVPAAQADAGRPKSRSACNRCHHQKLRCVKTNGRASCERCARLKTECQFGLRGRRIIQTQPSGANAGAWQEPRGLAPAIVPARLDVRPNGNVVLEGAELDWTCSQESSIDNTESQGCASSEPRSPVQISSGGTFDIGPYHCNQLYEPMNMDILGYGDGATLQGMPFHQGGMGGERVNHSFDLLNSQEAFGQDNSLRSGLGCPLTSPTIQLANLNVVLCECAGKLPSIRGPRAGPSVATADMPCSMDSGARSAALLALDEVFRITSEFIGIMNNLSVTTTSHQQFPDITTASATLTPACVAPQTLMRSREPLPKHAVAQDSQGPRTAPPTSQPFSRLDEATALLFLSCHCRLIEIYGAIFHAMQRCIGGSYAAPYAAAGIILPQLRVGGPGGVGSPALRVDFGSGPRLPPATISMYMALVATLSSQLWAQVQEALRGSGRESGRAPAGRLDVIGPTWDVAMEKTENMVRTIETVQRLL